MKRTNCFGSQTSQPYLSRPFSGHTQWKKTRIRSKLIGATPWRTGTQNPGQHIQDMAVMMTQILIIQRMLCSMMISSIGEHLRKIVSIVAIGFIHLVPFASNITTSVKNVMQFLNIRNTCYMFTTGMGTRKITEHLTSLFSVCCVMERKSGIRTCLMGLMNQI